MDPTGNPGTYDLVNATQMSIVYINFHATSAFSQMLIFTKQV